MISLRRSTSADPAFHHLVAELDEELRVLYGPKQSQYDVHNLGLDRARVVLAIDRGTPVGCGCFKPVEQADTVELKRMYVRPSSRRLGIARQLLTELERWAGEGGYTTVRLQTAIRQPASIALYQKCGYQPIAAYGAYVGDVESVCLEKQV